MKRLFHNGPLRPWNRLSKSIKLYVPNDIISDYYAVKIKHTNGGFFCKIYKIHLNGNLEFLMLVLRTVVFVSDFYTSGTDHGREGTWIWASTAQ